MGREKKGGGRRESNENVNDDDDMLQVYCDFPFALPLTAFATCCPFFCR